jgi:cytochrome c oxidase assembly factor CtaG
VLVARAVGALPRDAEPVWMPSPWSFSFEPLFVALAAVAVVLYARAWRREPGPAWRAWCFGTGVALVVVALNSPLGTIATEYLVLFHLLQNVMISDWAPPLLLIGLTPAMREASRARGSSSSPDATGGGPSGLHGWRRPPARS